MSKKKLDLEELNVEGLLLNSAQAAFELRLIKEREKEEIQKNILSENTTITVYRMQDAEGRGPWKPGFSHKWVQDRDDHDNLLPWPNEFGQVTQLAFSWEHIGCGCMTVDQLRRWFTKIEYSKLLTYGYKAVQLKASRILAQSETQCVFTTNIPFNSRFEAFDLYSRGVPYVYCCG